MNTQNNSSQIIAEKGPLDKIETDKFDKHLEIIESFVQMVKDGKISIDDMRRIIKAALKTYHMLELYGRQVCHVFTFVRKERTEKE